MRALLVFALLTAARVAEAGPYCWTEIGFAPRDKAELPIAPTIGYAIDDKYYGGELHESARPPALTATIDGKRAPISWTDVPTDGGVIRMLSIRSRATGKLELWRRFPYDKTPSVAATYTIVANWQVGEPKLSIHPGKDTSLGPYRWIGDYAGLRVDVPATAFVVKWRPTQGAAWQRLVLPVHAGGEAWLGEETCGMRENIPLAALAKGVEIDVRVKLPNGREVAVTDKPMPLQFVPTDRAPKPARATEPPIEE